MIITIQAQLKMNSEQAEKKMLDLMYRVNEASSWLCEKAIEAKENSKTKLQKLFYYELRRKFRIPAQHACCIIRKVAGTLKKHKDKYKTPKFRKDSAFAVDERLIKYYENSVNISTLDKGKRIKNISLIMGEKQKELWKLPKGEADIILRKGKWYLYATVEVTENEEYECDNVIGIDRGINNIITTSDEVSISGSDREVKREKLEKRKSSLQKTAEDKKKAGKRPRSIRRNLRKLSGKIRRFVKNENHCVAKELVATAKGTERGIVLEDLKNIRKSTKKAKHGVGKTVTKAVTKGFRKKVNRWSFAELKTYITYKARIAGVKVIEVPPKDTSITCSDCSYVDKRNRTSQADFECKKCKMYMNADVNASINIRNRGLELLHGLCQNAHSFGRQCRNMLLVQEQAPTIAIA